MEPLKLNLGCGAVQLDGYHNLDIKTGVHVYPLRLGDGVADEVRASHVLEHFPHGQVADVVKEWARVLKPGGRLKIAVPDFDFIVKAYSNGHRNDARLEHYLFGGQVDGDDYHKSFFNEQKLKKLLEDAGLQDVKRWESDADDCSSYHVSLNLEGRKPEPALVYAPTPTYEFIQHSKGVIHVGGNMGQARDIYAQYRLPVIWIEGLPSAWRQLADNIVGYPNQRALNYLITDKDGEYLDFHVANNDGQSSSLFDFGKHTEIWPEIKYTETIQRFSTTLKTALLRHSVNMADYDTLVMDVQGAELLVLKGAGDLLDGFKYIRAEACDFELYKGGCQLKDLDDYLVPRGFERVKTWHYKRSPRPEVERIYEALYQKRADAQAKPQAKARPQLSPIYIHDPQTGNKALYAVAAVTTVPRLGFQAHSQVMERGFAEPRIPILRTRTAFWEHGIQQGIDGLIKSGADYVITVDYDSIFTSEDVNELLRLIVRYPDADAIAGWQCSRWRKDTLLAGVRTQHGWGGTVTSDQIKNTDLTPVDNTVFGLTIIKTSAILKMKKPWFQNLPNADGDWEEGKFDADSYFWHKFREAGNTIYMANKVWIGHLQEVVLWCDSEFNYTKQDLTDWYASGRPF